MCGRDAKAKHTHFGRKQQAPNKTHNTLHTKTGETQAMSTTTHIIDAMERRGASEGPALMRAPVARKCFGVMQTDYRNSRRYGQHGEQFLMRGAHFPAEILRSKVQLSADSDSDSDRFARRN